MKSILNKKEDAVLLKKLDPKQIAEKWKKTFTRILFNRYSTLPLQWFVKIGLKKYIPGHTILIELEKKKN